DQVEEPGHRLLRIDQALIHVHVEDLRPVLHLLARDFHRLGVALLLDQLAELRAAGDVGALADVDEQQLRGDDQRFKAGQASMAGGRALAAVSRAAAGTRCATPLTASASARILSGLVPQQPLIMLSCLASAYSRRFAAISFAVSS